MKKLTKILTILLISAATVGSVAAVNSANKSTTIENTNTTKSKIEFSAFLKNQELNIEFAKQISADITIELFSVTGKKLDSWVVKSSNEKSFQLSLTKVLPTSLYIVQVTAQQFTAAKKVQF